MPILGTKKQVLMILMAFLGFFFKSFFFFGPFLAAPRRLFASPLRLPAERPAGRSCGHAALRWPRGRGHRRRRWVASCGGVGGEAAGWVGIGWFGLV